MPNIKAKNYYGEYVTRENADKVYFDSADTEGEKVPFTYGEVVEGMQIEPDFSAGDMTVAAGEGKLLREVTVVKPEDLVPEKIAIGEYIAGVGPGTHKGDSDYNVKDANLRYFGVVIDGTNKTSGVSMVVYDTILEDTGVYDVNVPGSIGGYSTVLLCT